MPSIPLTPQEEKDILSLLSLQRLEDLFVSIPPRIRETADFTLDYGSGPTREGLSEHQLRAYFGKLASKNFTAGPYGDCTHFLGGGVYDNIIPAIVNQLVLRGEWLTCYTPYQPEISQGTLQAIFEFQTMLGRLTQMEVTNASMYDGPTATAEAVLMAQRLSTKDKQHVLVAGSLAPDTRAVIDTFQKYHAGNPSLIGWTNKGTLDLADLKRQIDSSTPCAVVVGYPNYFGVVEPLDEIKALLPKDCLLVVSVQDPASLSIFEAPGKLGADIVAGEAHQLGTPMLFGGPHVGFLGAKKAFLRQMPGRLCGETTDSKGKRAYTLTLSTREQHIRREKATSNICTNQGLIALRTVIYLSFLGKQGFEQLGTNLYSQFEYLSAALSSAGIVKKFPGGTHFREGVFEVPGLERRMKKAQERKILPGIPLSSWGPAFSESLLICVNPKLSKSDMDRLVEVLCHD